MLCSHRVSGDAVVLAASAADAAVTSCAAEERKMSRHVTKTASSVAGIVADLIVE